MTEDGWQGRFFTRAGTNDETKVGWGLPLVVLQISVPQDRGFSVCDGPGTPAAGVRGRFTAFRQ
jgi:hypothetical protein